MANKASQARLWELESKTGTPGTAQSLIYDIRSLPKNHRVLGFMLVADYALSAAGATGRVPEDVAGLQYDMIEHSSDFFKLRATGYGLVRLFHMMNGKQWANTLFGAAIQSGRAPVFIPLVDTRSLKPSDAAIPTEILNGTSIEVKTTATTLVNLFGAAAAGTVSHRLFACLLEGSGAMDPVATRIDFEDWGGQTVNLKPGCFTHLALYKDRGASLDTAPATITPDTEVTRVDFHHGGAQICKNTLAWANVLEFNRTQVMGGFENNAAEQISDIAVPFLPVFTPPDKYSYAGLPGGPDNSSQLQVSGTLTTLRVLYRQATFKEAPQIKRAAELMGIPGTFARTLKTASKMDIAGGSNAPEDVMRRSRLSQLIPGRISAI